MKVAIPTRNGKVDDHFGHCEYYTIFSMDTDNRVISTETLDAPEGCGCKSNISSVLEARGVNLMLAGNMGNGAKNVLEAHHIQVIRGCSGPVDEVIAHWQEGGISDSGESCSHHEEGHECGNHHSGDGKGFKVIKE